MSTTKQRRHRAAPDERRVAILDAAADVVVERGLAETRVTDIADRVGVSHGLVHYYFPTKDALVTATMHHLADADTARLRRAVGSSTDAKERLDRLLRASIPSQGSRDGWLLWVDAWSAGLRNEAVRRVHEDLDSAWSSTLQQVIVDGVADGEFTCNDAATSAARLTALIDGLCLRLVLRHRGVTRSGVLAQLREAADLELGLTRVRRPARPGRAG
ncbi:MAG: TetR family transcriptional regulator C-terminal domain-containing protein [Actinomycetes bacterium]